MKRNRKRTQWLPVIAAVALGLSVIHPAVGTPPTPAHLRLMGERLSLRAENAPLSVIVRQFQEWGVTVDFPADHDPRLSVNMRNVDVETALTAILGQHDYVLRWRTLRGPLGPWQQLQAIRVLGMPVRPPPAEPEPADRVYDVVDVPGMPGALMVRDELLVRFAPGTSVEAAKRLLDQIDAGLIDGSPLVGAYRLRLRPHTNIPALVDQLAGHALIDHVEPHWAWRLPEGPGAGTGGMWAAGGGDAAGPDSRATRDPVFVGRVAVLDTGIGEDAPWRDALLTVTGTLAADDAGLDADGHGTRMSGLAGGFLQPLGVSWTPDAAQPTPDVLSIRIFDDQGVAPLAAIIRGIEQAVENGSRVMSLSWGGPQNSRFLEAALAQARRHDMVVLAAAGNEPTGEPVYPAALPGVLAVGALGPDGQPWERSNYGDFVGLAAPGFADQSGEEGATGARFAGTSVSTAYAAGILARYRAMNPDLSAEAALENFMRALHSTPVLPETAGAQPPKLDAAVLQRLFDD